MKYTKEEKERIEKRFSEIANHLAVDIHGKLYVPQTIMFKEIETKPRWLGRVPQVKFELAKITYDIVHPDTLKVERCMLENFSEYYPETLDTFYEDRERFIKIKEHLPKFGYSIK